MTQIPSQLAAYLDKVRRNYPYGIPRDAIRARPVSSSPTPAEGSIRCLLLVISELSELTPTDRDLALAISLKGLGIPETECQITPIPVDTPMEAIKGLIDNLGAPLSIVFGSSATPGKVERAAYGTILHTQTLADIRDSAPTKRAFWSLLKAHGGAK